MSILTFGLGAKHALVSFGLRSFGIIIVTNPVLVKVDFLDDRFVECFDFETTQQYFLDNLVIQGDLAQLEAQYQEQLLVLEDFNLAKIVEDFGFSRVFKCFEDTRVEQASQATRVTGTVTSTIVLKDFTNKLIKS